jgi:hypothetical protein
MDAAFDRNHAGFHFASERWRVLIPFLLAAHYVDGLEPHARRGTER